MADKYSKFSELFQSEDPKNYRIRVEYKASRVLIMAPHGGRIETGTSEIAASVAGTDTSLYCFEGCRTNGNGELHITSHNYDEPRAQRLASKSEVVVAIHGRADKEDPASVWVGGLDEAMGANVVKYLNEAGFTAKVNLEQLAGTNLGNICNRGRAGKGVQLEVPRTLRDALVFRV